MTTLALLLFMQSSTPALAALAPEIASIVANEVNSALKNAEAARSKEAEELTKRLTKIDERLERIEKALAIGPNTNSSLIPNVGKEAQQNLTNSLPTLSGAPSR